VFSEGEKPVGLVKTGSSGESEEITLRVKPGKYQDIRSKRSLLETLVCVRRKEVHRRANWKFQS